MNLSSAVKTVKSVITANSPVLLVGAAVAGVVTTGVLAAKGGYKARGVIDADRMRRVASPEPPFDTFLEYKEEFEKSVPELKPIEKIKLTWLCFVVPTITGVSTIASVVGVHTIHTKRHAALAGLYAVTTAKLDDYREQAEELLGPKKTQQLNDAVAQKSVDRDPLVDHEVIVTSGGNELCYDEWGGRYFLGSHAIIEQAFANTNLQLIEDGDANVNEFYDHLGLTPVQSGAGMGWSGVKIFPRFGTVAAVDGRSAISFRFHEEPKDLSRKR